ncbi:MAG: MBL fold metallo-hydrolase [Acidimicrobiia bacterium]|nr:MBL fold metallo-hydrolase [Acidimicrobiia bacterium]
MRATRAIVAAGLFALLVAAASTQQLPLKHDPELLTRGPVRIDTVKDGLFVVRGPFLPCGTRGCTPNSGDDGLIHEPGDVAVRVTPEGLILVDDKYPENVADVLARVKTISTRPVRYLLNSHHHGDHVSGNATVRRELGIDIIGHRNIRENFLRIKQPGEPNITFADQAAIHLGGVEVQLLHLGRGHTNGDTVTYFPDLKTIHMGDLVIDGMPVIDYAGGGSAIEFVSTIDNMLTIDFDTAIPGHGRVMTRDEVRAYRARFAELNTRMRDLARRGVPKTAIATLEQARAQLKLADLGWDNTVSTTAWLRNIGAHYDELASAR